MLLITGDIPRDLGYFELDHRACPAEMPCGIPRYLEMHTYTCTHCSVVVLVDQKRTRERYKCKGCNHHVCDNCAADMVAGAQCKTMEQKAMEYFEWVTRQPNLP